MLKHIVMFTMNHAKDGRELQRRLLALPAQISEIQHYEVGLHLAAPKSEDATKIVLTSHFKDFKSLEKYRFHAAHQELLAWLRDGRLQTIQAVDYSI